MAAYFATASEPQNCTARIYAYKAGKVADCDEFGPFEVKNVSVFFPAAVAPRIISQRGVFTVHPEPTKKLVCPKYFDIEAEFRHYFRRKLYYLAIEPSHIKADLDGLCETLEWQYRNGVSLSRFSF